MADDIIVSEVPVITEGADVVEPVGMSDADFADYFGDDFSDEEVTVEHAEENIEEDTSSTDEVNTDTATDGETEEPFIQDDIDLSYVPKELRKDTLAETLKAIDADRLAKIKDAENATSDLSRVKDLLKDEGYTDSFVGQFQKNVKILDQEVSHELSNARQKLQQLVDAGEITEAEANLEYGKYSKEVEVFKNTKIQESYKATNLAIVEDFCTKNKEVLEIPELQEVATVLITDIIKDGNMVDTERSNQYLQLGRKLYDEGYKKGLAAAKQQTETTKQEGIKKSVSNPQVSKGATAPPKDGGIPYASAAEVPDKIWNADTPQSKKIRAHFLKNEMLTLF